MPMISSGFNWGSKPLSRVAAPSRKRSKPDDELKVHKPAASNKRALAAAVASSGNGARHKKSKTPKIIGQALPLTRIIEVLDRAKLQAVLHDLVQIHPEISDTVNRLAPKPTLDESMELMRLKHESILSHLPYKCDMESDYSYLRIKPRLNEFFHCLSDFILNYLPPIELRAAVSLRFLDGITNLIHTLPNFTNSEFQYTKMMAYEQVVNCWMILLSGEIEPDAGAHGAAAGVAATGAAVAVATTPSSPPPTLESSELFNIIQELDLEAKVDHHDRMSHGKFKAVASFIRLEVENHAMLHQHVGFNDLITMDYSNYSLTARTSH